MLHVLFEIGGLMFWTLFGVFLLCEAGLLFNGKWGWGITNVITFMVLITLFSTFSPSVLLVPFKAISWMAVLKWAGVYVACGVSWAVFYWYLRSRKHTNKAVSLKSEWCRNNNVADVKASDMPVDQRVEMYDWVVDHMPEREFNFNYSGIFHINNGESQKDFSDRANRLFRDKVVPLPSRNKASISAWMAGWPFHMLWWGLGDLIVNFWEHLCSLTRSLFTAVTRLALIRFNRNF